MVSAVTDGAASETLRAAIEALGMPSNTEG
jgi:hypothetical protein